MSEIGLGIFTIFIFSLIILFLVMKLETSISKNGIQMSFFPFTKKKVYWNEVKEIKSEFVDVRMIFMQAKMETKIISDMAKKGLVPSETPPQKIIITKKD